MSLSLVKSLLTQLALIFNMDRPTGGHVEYCKKSKRWKCFIVVDDINKHVGWGRTEKRALAIVRDSLERRS
jgi:hypothetical protein